MIRILALLLVMMPLLLTCRNATHNSEETPQGALAVYDGGIVTAEDVDREMLKLPADYRVLTDGHMVERYEALAQKIVVDRILLEEAKLIGSDSNPQFQALARQIERNVYSDHYLASHDMPLTALTEEDLKSYFEANRDEFVRSAKRHVFHMFKRKAEGQTKEELVREMEALRNRVLAGESLSELVAEHSDSESRHRDGDLGYIEKGQFSADFDAIVFSLDKDIPSQPIVTADGVHLFMVQSIIRQQVFEFKQVRQQIIGTLFARKKMERSNQIVEGIGVPPNSFVPDDSEVARFSQNGDAGTTIMRIGDFQLTLGRFNQLLADRKRQLGGKAPADLIKNLLQEVRNREVIFQHMREVGFPELPDNEFQVKRDEELIAIFAQRKMRLLLERDPQRLQDHYQNNQMRFCTPLKLHLNRLTVTLGSEPSEQMAHLESLSKQLNQGLSNFEQVAIDTYGTISDLGLLNMAQISSIDPRAPFYLSALQSGAFSPPYRWGDHLILLEVRQRIEPAPLPFSLVRDAVLTDYLQNYSQKVFEEISDSLLESVHFKINPNQPVTLDIFEANSPNK